MNVHRPPSVASLMMIHCVMLQDATYIGACAAVFPYSVSAPTWPVSGPNLARFRPKFGPFPPQLGPGPPMGWFLAVIATMIGIVDTPPQRITTRLLGCKIQATHSFAVHGR
eukprot:scaffold6204_cov148-Skeletonema_menzelii.AAC.5